MIKNGSWLYTTEKIKLTLVTEYDQFSIQQ